MSAHAKEKNIPALFQIIAILQTALWLPAAAARSFGECQETPCRGLAVVSISITASDASPASPHLTASASEASSASGWDQKVRKRRRIA